MNDIYVNKVKLGLAESEAKKTEGNVKEIYLRLGGKLIEGQPVSQETPKEDKPKKKK